MTALYTVLRVTDERVPLFEEHVQRLGEASRVPLRHFVSQAQGGVYRVTWDGTELKTTRRSDSRLKEGSPTEEIYEACVAGIVAWDGWSLVLPPVEAPAVASVSEARIAAQLEHRRARIRVDGDWPILLINAVVGTCKLNIPGRGSFPATVRAHLDVTLMKES